MKLPGDSDKQNKGVSHEMMQRSLQSQRRVAQRVGLLEDKVDALESAEIEPGIDLGEIADGAKKIATKVGDKVGKNAQLLGDKAKEAGQVAGEKLGAAGQSVKDNVGKATDKLTDVGKGIRSFIDDKAKLARSMKLPTLGSDKPTPALPESTSGVETVAPKPEPKQNLLPPPKTQPLLSAAAPPDYSKMSKAERARVDPVFRQQMIDQRSVASNPVPVPDKVDKLEDTALGEDGTKKNVEKKLEDDFEIDPKLKKAFGEALALPAKSAAVALTDLLANIPAPSKEASKILNRNIAKLSSSFKLGAASSEVANDEADNDSDDKVPKWMQLAGKLVGKVINRVKGNSGGGGEEAPQLPSAPQQNLLPGAAGDPTHGRRAPYTGTADGIGLGDGSGRAMQPIKKRKSAAAKLFGLTPMGMAFNAGNSILKGAKSFSKSNTFNSMKSIGGKVLGATPMGIMAKFAMKTSSGIANIFSKGDQRVNLTELTDKTIQENRENADIKTEKAVALASGTGDVMSPPSPPSFDQEGSHLAQPNIVDSPYVDVYNTTSQF